MTYIIEVSEAQCNNNAGRNLESLLNTMTRTKGVMAKTKKLPRYGYPTIKATNAIMVSVIILRFAITFILSAK